MGGVFRRRRARPALLWSVALFWAVLVGLTLGLDLGVPERYDPEYAARLDRLRRMRADHADRPCIVALGSSRMAMAFAPEQLPPLAAADGRTVTVFNLSRIGAGPVYARMTYDRLLRDGLAPDAVVLELMPAFLEKEWRNVLTAAAAVGDLDLLSRYVPPSRVYSDYARRRLLAARSQRLVIGTWLAGEPPGETIGPLGGEVGRLRDAVTPDEAAEGMRRNVILFAPSLDRFSIEPGADRAVRDLLADCRARGAPAVVLLTPESTAFRAVYPPAAQTAVPAYLNGLADETGASFVDARAWLPDDAFTDGHHVTRAGQAAFTDRLGREVLVPLAARLPIR